MLLGCIADDFTGATDLANNLTRGGMRTVQTVGVPRGPSPQPFFKIGPTGVVQSSLPVFASNAVITHASGPPSGSQLRPEMTLPSATIGPELFFAPWR